MKKNLKQIVHILFPEASKKGEQIQLTEKWFFQHTYQRKLKNINFKYYAEPDEKNFYKAVNDSSKKKLHDVFFIILDTDQKESRDNLEIVEKEISKYSKKYKDRAEIILSNRSFEVWLCMFKGAYTAPFSSQQQLEADVSSDYQKKEAWYKSNGQKWYSDTELAIKNSKISRRSSFKAASKSNEYSNDMLEYIPLDFTSYNIKWLVRDVVTYTYFDILIEKLYALNMYGSLLIEIDVLLKMDGVPNNTQVSIINLKEKILRGEKYIRDEALLKNLSDILDLDNKISKQVEIILVMIISN
ncbi:RloB domain-containing protein [Enterococcus sp. DIV1314a]|uniref:RloB domain-containing protein n=1 Tax=Enterococcus sp. DIV1314a TaxID=2774660 RepID=UPI003F1F5238